MNAAFKLSVLFVLVSLAGVFSTPQDKPSREVARHPETVLITAWGAHNTKACSGVLLSPTHVLTVAHGVSGSESWGVTAPDAGGHTRQASGKSLRVHPRYRPGVLDEADIALLILDRPIEIGGEFPRLPGSDLYALETPLMVVGRGEWGVVAQNRFFQMRTTLTQVRSNNNLYGGFPQVSNDTDAGGPVYLARDEKQLVALILGHQEANSQDVGMDLYVPLGSRNLDWIKREISH